jgi:hypothetical protein
MNVGIVLILSDLGSKVTEGKIFIGVFYFLFQLGRSIISASKVEHILLGIVRLPKSSKKMLYEYLSRL